MKIFVFDGSFEGLLTAVFENYQQKAELVRIVDSERYMPDAFDESFSVISEDKKANRVWNGLRKKLPSEWLHNVYKAFLSEQAEMYQHIFDQIILL